MVSSFLSNIFIAGYYSFSNFTQEVKSQNALENFSANIFNNGLDRKELKLTQLINQEKNNKICESSEFSIPNEESDPSYFNQNNARIINNKESLVEGQSVNPSKHHMPDNADTSVNNNLSHNKMKTENTFLSKLFSETKLKSFSVKKRFKMN